MGKWGFDGRQVGGWKALFERESFGGEECAGSLSEEETREGESCKRDTRRKNLTMKMKRTGQ
jgi:hypothetical protein